MSNLVWLASYPKSGNTWLRAFIVNLIARPESPATLDQITAFFQSEANPKFYQRFLTKPVSEASFEELIALRPKVQQDIMSSQAQGSIMLKSHNQLTVFDGTPLHNLDATAAAIYVLRNPLDVVLSVADHFNLSIDQAIDFISDPNTGTATDEQGVAGFLGSWSQHVESWTRANRPQFLTLRYEDMLDKPLPTFTKVAKLFGIQASRQELLQAVDFASFKRLLENENKNGFAEKSSHAKRFFRDGRKNQWIEKLTEEQIRRVVSAHREQMAKHNYLPPKFR